MGEHRFRSGAKNFWKVPHQPRGAALPIAVIVNPPNQEAIRQSCTPCCCDLVTFATYWDRPGMEHTVKEWLVNAFHGWQARREARRLAQANAKKSLRDEPSKTRGGKGTGLPPSSGAPW
jgi:hypothetical protein